LNYLVSLAPFYRLIGDKLLSKYEKIMKKIVRTQNIIKNNKITIVLNKKLMDTMLKNLVQFSTGSIIFKEKIEMNRFISAKNFLHKINLIKKKILLFSLFFSFF